MLHSHHEEVVSKTVVEEEVFPLYCAEHACESVIFHANIEGKPVTFFICPGGKTEPVYEKMHQISLALPQRTDSIFRSWNLQQKTATLPQEHLPLGSVVLSHDIPAPQRDVIFSQLWSVYFDDDTSR